MKWHRDRGLGKSPDKDPSGFTPSRLSPLHHSESASGNQFSAGKFGMTGKRMTLSPLLSLDRSPSKATSLSSDSALKKERRSRKNQETIGMSQEESAILREMRTTQKRLEKNRQLEEWTLLKKEKSRQAQLERELEQELIREEAKERESRRQARISENKQKLRTYHVKIAKETEQIQNLRLSGLDPSAVMRSGSRYKNTEEN